MNFGTIIAVKCKDCLLASDTVRVCTELPALRKINSFLNPEDGGSILRETAARLTYYRSKHRTPKNQYALHFYRLSAQYSILCTLNIYCTRAAEALTLNGWK